MLATIEQETMSLEMMTNTNDLLSSMDKKRIQANILPYNSLQCGSKRGVITKTNAEFVEQFWSKEV